MADAANMTATQRAATLEEAYRAACLLELKALKPGNAHIHAAGHRMTVADLETSARVSAVPLCRPGAPVGRRIFGAVSATRAAVGCNTNLGIVLLAAPLLAAAETSSTSSMGFRDALHAVLDRLTVEDATAAYAAIRLATPAGLGSVPEHDVAAPATIDLRRAMALAADRDRVAKQYAHDYDDVFALGVTRLTAARQAGQPAAWGATCAFMTFLAAFPDSHIARKHGLAVAETVRAEAATLQPALAHGPGDHGVTAALLSFDRRLKGDALNPGTSADLTVASLLALACSEGRD